MSGAHHTAVLRGIAHARLYTSAGDGLETVIAKLGSGECGWVSKRMASMSQTISKNGQTYQTLAKEMKRAEKKRTQRGYALLLGALLADGDGVDKRLQSATSEVVAEAENQVTRNTDRARFFSKMIPIFMVMSFAPLIFGFIIRRAGSVVDITPPDPGWTLGLSGIGIAACAYLMVGRR